MPKRSVVVFAALSLLSLGMTGLSEVVVVAKPDTGQPPLPLVTFDGLRWSVEFTQPPAAGEQFDYLITGDANDIIASLHVETGIGSTVLNIEPASGPGTPNGILRIDSFTRSGFRKVTLERFEIEGELGEQGLDVESLGQLDVGGNVNGPVLVDGSIHGTIDIGGHLEGSIIAAGGNIGGDIAVVGNIGGGVDQRVSIFATSGIANITAHAIYADIDPGYDTVAADQPIRNITARHGDFAGSLRAGSFEGDVIDIGQDLRASITFGQPIDVAYRTVLRVGRSFLGAVNLPESGLGQGQITFNYRSLGVAWVPGAIVSFGDGAVVLDGPDYAALPAQLGGGAVGAVGFAIHGEASNPVENSVVTTRQDAITLRFYGRVQPDGFDSLWLERRPLGSDEWMLTPAGCSSVAGAGEDGRSLRLRLNVIALQNGWEYRVRASLTGSDVLRCDLGEGLPSPLVGDDQDYIFRVELACPADVNNDGRVNGADLSAMLFAFGTKHEPCGQRADLNGDDATDGVDLAGLLANFGSQCSE